MFYFVKTPGWLRKLYKGCVWQMPGNEKIIYLTFDDGPHPETTKFVLDTLNQWGATATFFCIGKNVVAHPDIYRRILEEGHAVGNHTFNHLNGWKTPNEEYMNNIAEAKKYIDSDLFRPPYGRISKFQLKLLQLDSYKLITIMWTVLSGDFDLNITKERCLRNVVNKSGSGSIVLFHDSVKAFEKMAFTLPKVLEHFSERGYRFEKIKLHNGPGC